MDDALGIVGVSGGELPPLPDDAGSNPQAGWLDPRAWFSDASRPFEIEIGCGKGTFILETAKAQAGVSFLGVEWAREFYLYTADRVRRAALGNVRMLRTDGGEFLRWRCASGVVDVVHLYFSDPWPKRKHYKNRVVQHRFLAEVWRVLRPGGELRVVTDHDELWKWDVAHFDIWTDTARFDEWCKGGRGEESEHQPPPPEFALPQGIAAAPFVKAAFVPPPWVGEGQVVGTNYERKFTTDTKPPHSVVLQKPEPRGA